WRTPSVKLYRIAGLLLACVKKDDTSGAGLVSIAVTQEEAKGPTHGSAREGARRDESPERRFGG
ncbi:MAG TPA: hypothetical protein VE173_01205, partial [Longimicrobiales bacterium]|nr:hypothetical protein [Longimicrobiales bacterium]